MFTRYGTKASMFVFLGSQQRNFSPDPTRNQTLGQKARHLLQRSRLSRRCVLGHACGTSLPTVPQRRPVDPSSKVFSRLSKVAMAPAGTP